MDPAINQIIQLVGFGILIWNAFRRRPSIDAEFATKAEFQSLLLKLDRISVDIREGNQEIRVAHERHLSAVYEDIRVLEKKVAALEAINHAHAQ